MKFAKYVVIAQMALSVVLVVIFVTRSNASNRIRAKADEHRGQAAAEHASDKGDKTDKPEKTEKAEKAEKGPTAEKAEKPAETDKADKTEPADKTEKGGAAEDNDDEAEGSASKKHPPKAGRLAQKETSEGGELKLDVKKDSGARFGTDPKVVAQDLLAGNVRFVEGHRRVLDLVEQRETTVAGQHPGVMVLSCADSRVPPELIFDRGVGDMFVVRSAGNIAEPVAIGSLEYAAEHLHTKVLLVLGHEKCGFVQAALGEGKAGSPNLEAMIDAISPAVRELKAWVDGEQLLHMAVEANVRRQAVEVLRRSPMLQAAVTRKELIVLRAIYDLQTGRVRPL
jgi:carbonic anhydrase